MAPRPADYYPNPAPTYLPLIPHASLSNTNSLTQYPHVPSSLDPRLIYAAQPSASYHFPRWQEPSMIPYPSAPLSRPKVPQPFFHFPSYLPTNFSYPGFCRVLSSNPSRNIRDGEQDSAGIDRRKGSINQHDSVHQQPTHSLPLAHGQASVTQGPTYHGQGMFSGSHNFSLESSTFIDCSTTTDNFMEKLLQHTLIGAEFDSSDRDPPPRCHPGTRLAILQRCLDFIVKCHGEGKLRLVVGPAGAGKSAVMQIVAEKVPDGIIFASVFLSVDGRQDGSKVILTVAYQLAVKSERYHQFIRHEITRDPSLVRKTLSVQFQRLIVEPFIHQRLLNPPCRFLVLIDGLDECDNPITQQELLKLISDFCILYPTSPIVWIVASRPEPHITSFFHDAKVASVYSKEEMVVDSEEASEDVQRYLRDALKKIQLAYPTLKSERLWPSEHDFTKIASAAGGLFAYASAVVKCISDPHYRDPVAQLRYVLEDIDAVPKDDISGRDHSMAQLDALYKRVLSSIPPDVMGNTKKLLLLYSSDSWAQVEFREQCNLLGLTKDAAYGVVRHLHAVAKVPELDEVDDEPLKYFHKSFRDFLFDFKRSGFCHDVLREASEIMARVSLRIVEEVRDFDTGEVCNSWTFGYLKGGPGICNTISLSWPREDDSVLTNEELKFRLYCHAMKAILRNFQYEPFQKMPCFDALTTRFAAPGLFFPFEEVQYCAFDKFRLELAARGKLEQVPLRSLDYASIWGGIEIWFTSPIKMDAEHPDSWNPSCEHEKWEVTSSQQTRWSTLFCRKDTEDSCQAPADIPRFNVVAARKSHLLCFSYYSDPECVQCDFCLQRLARHFMNNPNQLATVFVDSTGMYHVELLFLDADDGVSEWRYNFFHSGPLI